MILAKLNILETRLKNLPIQQFIFEILSSKTEQLEDINIDQLTRGERSDGSKITPRYANPAYAALKNARNPRPGRGTPDLNLEGDFYKGITARVTRQSIIVSGEDQKTPWLQFKYGNEIIGINLDTPNLKQDLLLPELLIKIRNYLGI